MRHDDLLISTLLRIYPAAWRREYGAELADVLAQRRLTVGTIADVMWNGVKQRLRYPDPAASVGIVVMLIVAAGIVSNIAAPTPAAAEQGFAAILRDSSHTLPTVIVAPLTTALYILVLVACGFWTYLQHRESVSRSGMAAVRLSALAGLPVMIVGILMLLGAVHLRLAGSEEAMTTWAKLG